MERVWITLFGAFAMGVLAVCFVWLFADRPHPAEWNEISAPPGTELQCWRERHHGEVVCIPVPK